MNTRFRNARTLAVAISLLLCAAGTAADEAGGDGSEADHEERGRHTLGLFVGITRESGENRGTIGIEYSYRFHEFWSAGAVIERAERDKESTLGVVFVHFWPSEFLYLGLGVGRKDPGEKRENTLRATLGYEFEVGKGWSISPQANVDYIENEDAEQVYGLVIGKRF